MAAFERISTLAFQPHDRLSIVDIRTTRLPSVRPSPDEYYNPLEHRHPEQPIKVWMAVLNLVRVGFGAGALGFPLAISQAGMMLGPILAIFTGVLIIHMHLVLLNCLNEISRQLRIPNISYRYGFRLAVLHGPGILKMFGNWGPTIIATFMVMSQVGICTVFVDFTADSLRDILDLDSTRRALMLLIGPYLFLEYFMSTLKIVSYISMCGNCLNLVGLILVIIQIFKGRHEQGHHMATAEPLPLLFAFGTFLFNLSSLGVILSLDKALENPILMTKTFGIVTIGMFVPVVISTIFGGLGYWAYGVMEENVLRSLAYDELLAMIAIGLYMVAVGFAYPIQCYPASTLLIDIFKHHDPFYEPSKNTVKRLENIFRPTFVVLTFSIAYMIPFQGPFVAFVGNLCTTMIALVFPAMMEIGLMYPGPYGKYNIYLIKNILVILVGVTSWLFGVLFCGNLIYVRVLARLSPNDAEYF